MLDVMDAAGLGDKNMDGTERYGLQLFLLNFLLPQWYSSFAGVVIICKG
jgi:hypothetical protein